MSDGPHKSLPMSRAWKKLMLCAGTPAFPLDEVADALQLALVSDWRKEIHPVLHKRILEIVYTGEGLLFRDQQITRLQELDEHVVGYPLALVLIDCVARAVDRGDCDHSCLVRGTRDALSDRASRCMRQVEEHCHRECSDSGVANLLSRLRQAALRIDYSQLAQDLLGCRNETLSRPKRKKTALDDGVPLG